jgi:type III secretory pathway component EscT
MTSLPSEEIARVVRLVGLGAARTLPLAWFVPAFGGASVPAQLRLAFGLGLAVLCLPALGAHLPVAQTWLWFVLALREAMVGVTLGFVCACMFRAAEAAGHTIDVLRGQNLAEVLSPTGENRTSPFGALYLLFAVVVFFEIGGLGFVATALARSYEAVPLAAPLGERSHAMALLLVMASGRLIEAAVGLCAPVMVALLLADIVLGAIGRAVPGIPIFFVGMPLRALLAIGVVLLGLVTLDVAVRSGFARFMEIFAAVSHG